MHYDPLRASRYISLPAVIHKKMACLNINNKDQKCFLWSILASLHSVLHGQHPTRVTKYLPFENEIDTSGI